MKFQMTFQAGDRESWRAWLSENHTTQREVWVIFPKKQTGKTCMSYEESVEEALCFGWIDSIVRRIDDSTYARKFTPRRDYRNWSELNKKRAAKCIREGRMTEAGMIKIHFSRTAETSRPTRPKVVAVPVFMTKALKTNPQAWKNFNALPDSQRRHYTMWITDAKRDETREKRLNEAIRLLAENKRLGLK